MNDRLPLWVNVSLQTAKLEAMMVKAGSPHGISLAICGRSLRKPVEPRAPRLARWVIWPGAEKPRSSLLFYGDQSVQEIDEALIGLMGEKPHHLRLEIIARDLVRLDREIIGLSQEALAG